MVEFNSGIKIYSTLNSYERYLKEPFHAFENSPLINIQQ